MMEAVDRTAGIADGLAADLVDTFATNMETIVSDSSIAIDYAQVININLSL